MPASQPRHLPLPSAYKTPPTRIKWAVFLAFPLLLGQFSPSYAAPARPTQLNAKPALLLPKGAKALGNNHYLSPIDFRRSVHFYRQRLRRFSIAHREIGPYRYRGILIMRFIVEDPNQAISAIHVFVGRKSRTKVHITLVRSLSAPRPLPKSRPDKTENPQNYPAPLPD